MLWVDRPFQQLKAGGPGYLANCLRNERPQNVRMCGTDPCYGVVRQGE